MEVTEASLTTVIICKIIPNTSNTYRPTSMWVAEQNQKATESGFNAIFFSHLPSLFHITCRLIELVLMKAAIIIQAAVTVISMRQISRTKWVYTISMFVPFTLLLSLSVMPQHSRSSTGSAYAVAPFNALNIYKSKYKLIIEISKITILYFLIR